MRSHDTNDWYHHKHKTQKTYKDNVLHCQVHDTNHFTQGLITIRLTLVLTHFPQTRAKCPHTKTKR